MIHRKISVKNLLLLALAAAASLPALACGGADANAQNPQTAQQQPYPQQQGYPQQYPQQAPPQGYPQQYPQQQAPQGYPQQQPVAQQPQQFPQQPAPASPTAPAAPAASGTAASPLPGFPFDPNSLGQLLGGAGTTAAPAGQGSVTDLAGIAIKIAQPQYAPSPMQPEGNMSEDTLQPGQRKDVTLTLSGGKCYTIIGASPLGQITNLNITLLAPPFYNMNAGTDNMTGNTAVIGNGSAPICPITPFPLQYKLAVTAVAGQGTFAVQLYSKNK